MSPPSLPTGTVSSDRQGAQTYPRSPERTESPSVDGLERRTEDTRHRTGGHQRRKDARQRRNDVLERRLAERDVELQRVIDHYENLLAKRSREQPARESAGETLCTSVTNALDRVTDVVDRLRTTFVGR